MLLEEYRNRTDSEFQKEWSKKKFKWFLKNRRQNRLRTKIFRRHTCTIFPVIEYIVDECIPKVVDNVVDNMIDIKDVALGDKVYFKENG